MTGKWRPLLRERHRREVKRAARGRLERSDASLTEDDLVVAPVEKALRRAGAIPRRWRQDRA